MPLVKIEHLDDKRSVLKAIENFRLETSSTILQLRKLTLGGVFL